ncbi:MAG: tRNA 4-thiouridine(8) synthase ThiI [Proteobacteria bacterium]|nr:tRNA 4-thiouridine(8) synthase ThiI [Pseudomonadota bacterium]
MTELNYTGPGIVLRFGELFLKGKNRYIFENALERNVRRAVADRNDVQIWRVHGRIFVLGADDDDLVYHLQNVFGISSISKAVFCERTLDTVTAQALELAEKRPPGVETFRISARRSYKAFPYTSTDLGRIVGAEVVKATGLKVDLEKFDLEIGIEIGVDWTFLWSTQKPGAGGLPVGTAGKAVLLLSGGIDSPVAGHLLQKRGLELTAVYFHSFPYTGDHVKDKVIQLTGLLARRQKSIRLFTVPFARIQELFRDEADAKYLVILYRRAMIRIAEMIAHTEKIPALITGESLGQVASQTLPNLAAIQDAAKLPILRPLIGFDKAETIALARKIGSYNISIIPHDDCCSLFVPKHPETKAKAVYIRKIEQSIDWFPLLDEAVNAAEIVEM